MTPTPASPGWVAAAPALRRLLPRAELAAKLGHATEWFNKHLPELLADGFPPPALGTRSGARWDPAAVDDWLDRKRPLKPAPDAAAEAQLRQEMAEIADEIDAAADRLAAEAAQRRRAG